MFKVSSPNVQSGDTQSNGSQQQHASQIAFAPPLLDERPAEQKPSDLEQRGEKRLRDHGNYEDNPAFSVANKSTQQVLDDDVNSSSSGNSSERNSIGSDQGPLVASVGADGEPQTPQQATDLTETEDALIARQTDMLAPKAAVPELRSPVREGVEPSGSNSLPHIKARSDAGSSPSSGSTPAQRSASSSGDQSATSEVEGKRGEGHGSSQGSSQGSSSARDSTKNTPTLGPMEPMEPMEVMEPASSTGERKKLPPLNAGFPTVPGFPPGDPGGANALLPPHGKRMHNLPSLVENARNMTSSRRGGNSQFGSGNTNLMADIYTQSGNDSPFLQGIANRDRVSNFSTASRASGWGYEDESVNGTALSQAGSYASSSARGRDPRFSYTYPHGMLTGPAGIMPEGVDNLGHLSPQYSHVAPPPMMALASSVPYQPSHATVPVVPQHQQHQQPLASATYPVLMNPQQVYPQMSAAQYVHNPQESMDSMAQRTPVSILPASREASAAPMPHTHAGHGSGPGGSSAGRQALPPAASESRTYHCTYPGCEWSFVRSSDQKRHIRSHEKPSLQCPYWEVHSNCNRKGGLFYRLDVLKRHLRLVHLIRPANGADDGGSCRVCGKEFEHTRDFINHCNACAEDAKERMLREGSHADSP